jgi:potassium uptake TrkH family protein
MKLLKDMFRTLKEIAYGKTPAQFIFRYYTIIIFIGAIILMMPFSLKDGVSLNFLDALFTATSAASVTGLIVVNTPDAFTIFGQVTILILILFGGLGVMVIKGALWILLKRKIGLVDRELIMTEQNQVKLSGMVKLVKSIILITFTIVFIGMSLLTFRFVTYYDFGIIKGLWYGLFHSISAVNNAGFDITGASLIPFVHDYFIQTVFILLIIFGGIGFPVILEISNYLERKRLKTQQKYNWTLFTRVSVSTYFIILVVGFILILGMEWNNYLADNNFTFLDKIYVALFQSVTTRNAGFATVPLEQFAQPTIFVMTMMMFVGAAPSSTGGGIRTTTFALVVLFVVQSAIGRKKIDAFKRTIPFETVNKALVTFTLGIFINLFAALIISATSDINFIDIIFEVASAFGTTGLSTNTTTSLNTIGRIVIILVMFIGQIGITTILLVWLKKGEGTRSFEYPEENLLVG